jgi:hypothetical protein
MKLWGVFVTCIFGWSLATTTALAAVSPPFINAVTSADVIFLNASTTFSFSLINPNGASTLTGVGFSDFLPPILVVANPNGISGSCGGGAIIAPPGSGLISLIGATLAPNEICVFSVNVKGVATGGRINTAGPVTSTEGGLGLPSSFNIFVLSGGPAPPAPIPTLQQWALVILGLLIGAATIARGTRNK